MKEIRLCWTPDVEHEPRGVFRDGGFWFGDFDEPRRALTLIMKSENAVHGSGTHWIEERELEESEDDVEPLGAVSDMLSLAPHQPDLNLEQKAALLAWAAASERVNGGLIAFINDRMPSHEEMDHALNDAQSCLERLRKAFCDPLG
ncbi:hypothetical protein [Variovorax guangxiensis]|uniref:hypothetical protein n=1 Tax=Variovorax guangxiensis TaxID=1775474 RepID=UPI001127EC70|nr:hypothetical protein [Variovorax guangxiensis]